MSERFLHVYRVTEVAEWSVEDDGIYEDDAEMFADVLAAAKGGLLDFEPSDAGFVAMAWDEENRLVVRAIEETLPEGAERASTYCPECFGQQFLTASGLDCQRGHGDLAGLAKAEVLARREARAEPAGPTRSRDLRPPRPARKRNSR
jgi:hypothetical protein